MCLRLQYPRIQYGIFSRVAFWAYGQAQQVWLSVCTHYFIPSKIHGISLIISPVLTVRLWGYAAQARQASSSDQKLSIRICFRVWYCSGSIGLRVLTLPV
jgi:hypothetical protein